MPAGHHRLPFFTTGQVPAVFENLSGGALVCGKSQGETENKEGAWAPLSPETPNTVEEQQIFPRAGMDKK